MSKTKKQIESELRSMRVKLAHAERLAIERLNDLNRLQTARREDMQLHDNLQDKLLACEAERDQAMSAAAELRDRIGNLEAGIADRNAKVTRLHKERDAALKERDDARARNSDLARRIADADADLRYWKDQHNEVMGKLSAADKLIDELTAQRDEARAAESKAEAELGEAMQELEVVRARLTGAETAVESLLAKRDEVEAERDYARGQAEKAWAELDPARKGLDRAREELNKVEAELAAEQTRSAQYAAKLVEKGAAVAFLEGKLDATMAELTALRLDLESASNLRKLIEADRSKAESRADYWELRAKEAMRPWWRKVLARLTGGRK